MTDPLDDLRAFTDFRARTPAATPTALEHARRAVATARDEASRNTGTRALPRWTSRRSLISGVAVVAVLAVVLVVVGAAWPTRPPGTLELLAQARAALAPDGRIVHYRVTVTADSDGSPRGVIERTEGWVQGSGERRTEGREISRTFRAGREDDAGWTETSWRPDGNDPRRTVVLERSAVGRAPSGPAVRRVVGSARPTASAFASSLDPRQDGTWTLVRRGGNTVVLSRSQGGSARLTVEIDRTTGLPRRFVLTDVLSRGGRSRYVTDVATDQLPATAANDRLLTLDAPSSAPVVRWGTREASALIERARRLLSPPDGLVTVTSRTTFSGAHEDARGGRSSRTIRQRGTFLFENGVMLLGRLTAVRGGKDVCPTSSWIPDPRDPDRVLFRDGARMAVSVDRPTANPVPLNTLTARSDGWRVARTTKRRILLRAPARQFYSGGELVLDRQTGAVVRATTSPSLQEEGTATATTIRQQLTVTSRMARPGEPRIDVPRC